jgi:hypothetical protein
VLADADPVLQFYAAEDSNRRVQEAAREALAKIHLE